MTDCIGIVFAYIDITTKMRRLAVFLSALSLIAIHDAWQSFECPLLLSVATLVCIMIKSKKDEQKKKK